MRRSAIALALGFSAASAYPVLAATETLLSFQYETQENCVWAPGFTPDFDALNFANIGWSDYHGTITFDISNHKALMTLEGTFQTIPCCSPNPPGTPSGLYPVTFFNSPSPCVFDLKLSSDLSFVLVSNSDGCSTVALNGPNVGLGGTVFDINITGQFAPDKQSFVAGHAGASQQQQPIIQTQRFNNGFQQQRICTSVTHAVRLIPGKQ